MSPVAAFFAGALAISPPIPVLSQADAALVVVLAVVLIRSPRRRVQHLDGR